MVSRNSQQRGREAGGSVPRGGGGRSGQGKVIVIPSNHREPKLKTTENAWKPSAKEASKATADDAQASADAQASDTRIVLPSSSILNHALLKVLFGISHEIVCLQLFIASHKDV